MLLIQKWTSKNLFTFASKSRGETKMLLIIKFYVKFILIVNLFKILFYYNNLFLNLHFKMSTIKITSICHCIDRIHYFSCLIEDWDK